MRLEQIMRRPVKTISGSASVESALGAMRAAKIRHLIVKDGTRILGVVSDRDLLSVGDAAAQAAVERRITRQLVTAGPATTVREAANFLRGNRIGCLPVIDEKGRLAGIVTTTDLLDLLGRGSEAPSPRKKRAILARRGPGGRSGVSARRAGDPTRARGRS